MHLETSPGYLNAIRSSFIVFIITIVIIFINVTIIRNNSNSYNTTNTATEIKTTTSTNVNTNTLKISNSSSNSASNSAFSTIYSYFNTSTTMERLFKNRIVVVLSAKPSAFKGNISQQQQQQQQQGHEQNRDNFNLDSLIAAGRAATISADGVKKNVATNFTYTIDAISNSGNATRNFFAATAAAASLNNNGNVVIVDDNGNSNSNSNNNDTNDNVAHDDDNNVLRNSFYDKINKSNQQNEFNERLETTTAIPIFTPPPSPASALSSSSFLSKTVKHDDALSTSSENAELLESMMLLYTHQRQQEQQQQHKQYQKLLLHRQKRYLLFPEGSSFQLVFDLIIPIVDYTNFAIMGITCAVAWELPSKPPSEIIENFRDKLNEGHFGPSRRNDSKTNIQYVDSNINNDGGFYSGDRIYGATVPLTVDYANNAQIPATVVGTNSAFINNENENRKTLLTSAKAPTIPYNNLYKNKPIMTTTKNTQTQQQKQQYAFQAHSSSSKPFSYYTPSVPFSSSEYQTYPHHRPQNYFNGNNDNAINFYDDKNQKETFYQENADNENNKTMGVNGNNNNKYNNNHNNINDEYVTSNSYSKYYKNTNGDSGTSGYALNAKDKLKFTDWHQQHWRNEYEGTNKYYQQEQKLQQRQQELQQQQQQQHQAQQNMKYAGWDKNNWWHHNTHRIQNNWREKQNEWLKYENEMPPPSPSSPPQKPLGSTATNARTGRYRKILQLPPKHRVYPVFGKRRRRRRDADAFELKLELIHLREQLQTRQKLYGKIEKLYKVRGHNGTACVLRALCETGQRQHQTEPQTFITELLRAIFVLPEGLYSSNSYSRSNQFPPSYRRINRDMNEQQQQQQQPKLKPKPKLRRAEIKLEQFNAYIEKHYWEAAQQHAHDRDKGGGSGNSGGGNCAQRFAMCEHSFWSDSDI